ncbi:MAG: FtsK/SpoIIIE domain-containing protein, partial [Micrococcales bacterium]|nr:FtsK/SpoIIIE domain-containing protein [Micrococcales bacterium]
MIDGLDRGKEFPLSIGTNTVGRGRDSQVRLTDPMISRRHVRLNITDEAELIDLGSANGTSVAGEFTARKVLRADDVVEIGNTRFTVRLLQTSATQGRVESAAVGFIRSPRLVKPYEGRTFPVPEIPVRQQNQRFSVVGLVAPIGMALMMWMLTHQLMSILFMALSPIMLVGNWLEQTLSNRSTYKRQLKAWRADLEDLVDTAREEAQAEVAARLMEHPSTRECVDSAMQRSNLLWTRRVDAPGFAELRCGLGSQPSRIDFDMPDVKRAPRALLKELVDKLEPFSNVDGVPVVAPLPQQGGLGVAGPRSAAASVARSLVAQAVALHSPNELQLCVLASARSSLDWDWVKWLPHTTASRVLEARALADSPNAAAALVGELEELVAARAAAHHADGEIPLPVVMLVVEADAPVEFGRLVDLVETGWHHGVYVLWVAPDLDALPAACRVFVDVRTLETAGVGYLRTGDMAYPVTVELMELAEAMNWAHAMSPITDLATRSDDSTDVPRFSSFVSIVGKDVLANPQAVIERWCENNSIVVGPHAPATLPHKAGTLRAAVGNTSSGLHVLDLRAQGPHALVGGTTGAGKSELLQTWVLGMAANHSPARVNFLLVDYKGGSAFAEAAQLPHTVGLVTDLGLAGVHRALASLRAELRRREHLLNAHKAKDLVALEKSDPVAAPPALVIVVDEFAALVTEVPEFIDGVIDVAARGRSLGLHLILATQRPAGVIKDSLRANTNLRLALRVADVDDSTDVLGAPDAAYFDQDVPGRAMSKTGPGRLVAFQTAYVGGHTGDTPPQPSIEVETLGFGQPVTWEQPSFIGPPPTDIEESDLKRIVRTIQQAHVDAELPAPVKPWLPDLATYYNLADLQQVPNRLDDAELVFAIGDDPDNQRQPTIVFRPDVTGNLAIYGAGGAGKSTLLRTLAVAAGMTAHGGPCHVYGLDFSSRGLAMIEGLPHVGSVVNGTDDERVRRLIDWLRTTIDERAARYAGANAATIAQYRTISGKADEPRILVLVDGIAGFRAAYDGGLNFRVWDSFVSIASDGRPVGVHIVMTSDQTSGLPPMLSATVQQRVVMRMADDDDYRTLGAPIGILTSASPPGRCLADNMEAQVVLLGGDPSEERKARQAGHQHGGPEFAAPTDAQSQATNLHLFSVAIRKTGVVNDAPPIRRLPELVSLAS